MIAPLGIVSFRATSNIKADGSVFGISFTTAVYIVGDDKGKILEILGVGRWVDVEVDYCIPLLAIGYYVILGESRPKAGSKIRFPKVYTSSNMPSSTSSSGCFFESSISCILSEIQSGAFTS